MATTAAPPEETIMASPLSPSSEEELAKIVAESAAARTPLEIAGGGDKLALGNPVEGRRLSTARLSGVTIYEPASLTLVARAGTPLSQIRDLLAGEGQHLPFEPADYRKLLGSSGEPTIGGTAACGVSGPRRIQAGALRDSAIGVRFVDGSGEIIKNGGRVMKNVTGYDLVKLLCGSWGTLGVLTEVSLKLLPRPETAATLVLHGLDAGNAVAAMSEALGSPYDVTGAAHLPGASGEAARTIIRVEGFSASVAYRVGKLREALAGHGEITVEDNSARHAALWGRVRDVEDFAGTNGAVWKVSLRPSDAPVFLDTVGRSLDARHCLDWGGGLVWLLTPESGDCGASVIRTAAVMSGGHAMLFRAPAQMRAAVGAFHPEKPSVAAISAALARKFDPAGILNPGRMIPPAPARAA
jgi:glycolate oxidase FAD binding subunit